MKLHDDEVSLGRALEAIKRARQSLETAVTLSILRGKELEHKRGLIDAEHMHARRKQICAWSKWL